MRIILICIFANILNEKMDIDKDIIKELCVYVSRHDIVLGEGSKIAKKSLILYILSS